MALVYVGVVGAPLLLACGHGRLEWGHTTTKWDHLSRYHLSWDTTPYAALRLLDWLA